MERSARTIIVAGVVILVVGGLMLVGLNAQNNANNGSTTGLPSAFTSPTPSAAQLPGAALTITYTGTGTGFEPDTADVAVHSAIIIRNRSQRMLQFVSDPYPTNDDEPELNVGQLNPGESQTFYISQKGIWGYHNAADPAEFGTITVD